MLRLVRAVSLWVVVVVGAVVLSAAPASSQTLYAVGESAQGEAEPTLAPIDLTTGFWDISAGVQLSSSWSENAWLEIFVSHNGTLYAVGESALGEAEPTLAPIDLTTGFWDISAGVQLSSSWSENAWLETFVSHNGTLYAVGESAQGEAEPTLAPIDLTTGFWDISAGVQLSSSWSENAWLETFVSHNGTLYAVGESAQGEAEPTLAPIDLTTGFWDISAGVQLSSSVREDEWLEIFVSHNGTLYAVGESALGEAEPTLAPIDLTTGFWDISAGVQLSSSWSENAWLEIFVSHEPIPEPNTALLLGIGMMGLGMRRRRATNHQPVA